MKWLRKERKHRGKVWPGSDGLYYWGCYTCLERGKAGTIRDEDWDPGGRAWDINQGSDLLRDHLQVVHGELK